MPEFIDQILHVDKYLQQGISQFGPMIYAILWAVVFCETGLIIFPFLPGDSLLFASGMFSNPALWTDTPGAWHPNILVMCLVYISAAIVGDSTNFWIGRNLGVKLFKEDSKLFKKKHLEATYEFFEKHGAKAIIIGRFVPIVRTLVPFVAGLQKISYKRFIFLSITGSLIWVGVCCGAGYLFGAIPWVKENFEKVILIIVGLSVLAVAAEGLRNRRHKKQAAKVAEAEQV